MIALLTGGAGFVGLHALGMLLEGGHDVVVLGTRQTSIRGDVRDRATITGQFRAGDVRHRVEDVTRGRGREADERDLPVHDGGIPCRPVCHRRGR